MRSTSTKSALFSAAALFLKLTSAARACGSTNTTSTYLWRVGDARYDGADPKIDNGTAVVAISILPNGTSTFFECVAEWPEPWAGWSPVDGNIIWSDCIYSGAGPTYDTAVAFALDWKTRTMYLSHTFTCSDQQGSDSIAIGSFLLDLDCKNAEDTSSHCTLKSKPTPELQVKTAPRAPRLPATATCEDNAKVYQSWQVQSWRRSYRLAPGETVTPPAMDSGPSFNLRNMANGDTFVGCVPSGNRTEAGVFNGTCKPKEAVDTANSTVTFQFDPVLDILTITQSWACGATSSFDVSGVGFVQATCDRQGEMLSCTSLPFWIGTKTV